MSLFYVPHQSKKPRLFKYSFIKYTHIICRSQCLGFINLDKILKLIDFLSCFGR